MAASSVSWKLGCGSVAAPSGWNTSVVVGTIARIVQHGEDNNTVSSRWLWRKSLALSLETTGSRKDGNRGHAVSCGVILAPPLESRALISTLYAEIRTKQTWNKSLQLVLSRKPSTNGCLERNQLVRSSRKTGRGRSWSTSDDSVGFLGEKLWIAWSGINEVVEAFLRTGVVLLLFFLWVLTYYGLKTFKGTWLGNSIWDVWSLSGPDITPIRRESQSGKGNKRQKPCTPDGRNNWRPCFGTSNRNE